MHVIIEPLAKFDSTFLDSLAENIQTVFNYISDRVYFSYSVKYQQKSLPKLSYDISKKQYNAELILDKLHFKREDSSMILGIVDVDIWSDPHVFLYGKADVKKKVAIISLYRLVSQFDQNPQKVMERAVKESVHELGHLFGLDHCSDTQCVMIASETVSDIDRKSTFFCPRCVKRLVGINE